MEPHEAVSLIGGEYHASVDLTLDILGAIGTLMLIVLLGWWLWVVV